MLLIKSGFRGDRDWLLVEYSRGMKALSISVLIGYLFLVYSAHTAHLGPRIEVFWILYFFLGLFATGVLDVLRCKLWFDSEKIYYQSTFGRKIVINISDIQQCKIIWGGNTYRIISKHGKKIYFSPYMSGGDEFYHLVKQYLGTRKA